MSMFPSSIAVSFFYREGSQQERKGTYKELLFKEFLWLVVLEDDVQALLSDRVLEYVIIEKNFELVSKKKWMKYL